MDPPVRRNVLAKLLATAVGSFMQPGVGIDCHLLSMILAQVDAVRNALEDGEKTRYTHTSAF